MTTNKPGSVNQQPFYICTCCIGYYEDYMWPADQLRVHDGECWCDSCWEERQGEFQDQPDWYDLEPYTPALQAEIERLQADHERLQAECDQLRKDASRLDWLADPENQIGEVLLPTEVVEQNPHSMRDAIDAAMEIQP